MVVVSVPVVMTASWSVLMAASESMLVVSSWSVVVVMSVSMLMVTASWSVLMAASESMLLVAANCVPVVRRVSVWNLYVVAVVRPIHEVEKVQISVIVVVAVDEGVVEGVVASEFRLQAKQMPAVV
ncbi:hypothetical protein GN958_ATG09225 [Phytophthora infestans]|uniref:Uncharacterized protein n=1 Tax=Phytophthora infestans TaxID=4787 RepID=A0A8S9ULL5_PHYIN|nr:hypothetical protein GN958_ATG09225 [Phytophthora infestans]KAI9989222.1 hypothetical protein PInf_019383 [Phytophthora infestans]